MDSQLPPLQCLRAFVVVAETRGFTAAAHKLGVTQTAVSHQIAQLEAWLGFDVFVRNRAGVALTEAGAAIHPAVAEVLGRLGDTLQRARRRPRHPLLRISTGPEFGTQWLTPRLERFRAAHPGVEISLTLEYRRVEPGADEADVVIRLGGGGGERLTRDDEFAVSSPGLARTLPKRRALLAAPLLRYEGARNTLLDWRRWCGLLFDATDDEPGDMLPGLDIDGGPLYPTFAAMLEACRSGKGFALVRNSLVAEDLERGTLVRCFTETLEADLQYHLLIAPTARRQPEVVAFRDWILSEASA